MSAPRADFARIFGDYTVAGDKHLSAPVIYTTSQLLSPFWIAVCCLFYSLRPPLKIKFGQARTTIVPSSAAHHIGGFFRSPRPSRRTVYTADSRGEPCRPRRRAVSLLMKGSRVFLSLRSFQQARRHSLSRRPGPTTNTPLLRIRAWFRISATGKRRGRQDIRPKQLEYVDISQVILAFEGRIYRPVVETRLPDIGGRLGR